MLSQVAKGNAPDGLPFQVFTLTNSQQMAIQVTDWGATWLSCQVPIGADKSLREVLLGCQLADYAKQSAYLGATVGRYANRIANSQFTLNNQQFKLVANQGEHQLHGGVNAFDKQRWQLEKCGENFVRFSLFSADGDQGFPGNVHISVTYQLNEDNSVDILFDAVSDQDTALNLTNHAYFNLMDAEQGCDVREHLLQLNADYYLPVDSQGIPNAPLKSVANTSFDFRQQKSIAQDFLQDEQILTKGYDHSFLLNRCADKPCAILTAPDKQLRLAVFTSQPALQVYAGNYLAGTPTRSGNQYGDNTGIALETQALPDTPNHPEWWQYGGISKANEPYQHWTKFQFL